MDGLTGEPSIAELVIAGLQSGLLWLTEAAPVWVGAGLNKQGFRLPQPNHPLRAAGRRAWASWSVTVSRDVPQCLAAYLVQNPGQPGASRLTQPPATARIYERMR